MWPRQEIFRAWALASIDPLDHGSHGQQKEVINAQEVAVPLEKGSWVCSEQIVKNGQFANSYGHVITGNYTLENNCQDYTQVVLTFEASVSGRQFDRTGAFWFGGTELLRFTTAEPSGVDSSTEWKVEKDVSVVKSIFKDGQPWVLALDNIVNNIYTGIFIVSVSLDFYTSKDFIESPASIVYPLSASKDSYGWFVVSSKTDVLTFDLPHIPSNTVKLQLDTFWSAHQNDEFWYTNVPDGIASPSQGIYGGGSFKELEVFIDDKLIGMDWLFPTIYSGGMNPLLWRPVVSIGTFDVPYSILDLTYVLPLINSSNHKLSLSLGSEPNPFWLISSRLLIWTDGVPDFSTSRNRGEILSWNIKPTKVHEFSGINFDNEGIAIHKNYSGITIAGNKYSAESKIRQSNGSWSISKTERSIDFRNEVVNSDGNSTVVCQLKSVIEEELFMDTYDDLAYYKKTIKEYPLYIKLESITEQGRFEFRTDLKLLTKKDTQIQEKAKKYQTSYSNSIYGNGYFGTIRPGMASHKQEVRFKSPMKCYSRVLSASNRSIDSDDIHTSCNNTSFF